MTAAHDHNRGMGICFTCEIGANTTGITVKLSEGNAVAAVGKCSFIRKVCYGMIQPVQYSLVHDSFSFFTHNYPTYYIIYQF